MKDLLYIGTFDIPILRNQLLAAFPSWRDDNGQGRITEYFGMDYDQLTSTLRLSVPDNADEIIINQVIDMHDPSAQLYTLLTWQEIISARNNFMTLPNWSIWTAEEASGFVSGDILAGMNKTEIEDWIDLNVTTLATAKTALKLLADELIDSREITAKIVTMLVYLRDVAIRRRL